jgi:uncharacterized membrane protein
MNAAQVHMALNHVPVLGAVFGLILLAVAVIASSPVLRRTALAVLVATALAAVPVFLSGEPAEEVVERAPGVSEATIEPHEEAAEAALVAVSILGVLSLAALVFERRFAAWARWTTIAVLLLAVATSAMMLRTAHLGGLIRHPELRGAGSTSEPARESGAEHDDD